MAERKVITELTTRVAAQLRVQAAVQKISRAEVSRRTGMSQSMGNRIFRGEKSPSLDQLQLMATALGTTPLDLIIGSSRISSS